MADTEPVSEDPIVATLRERATRALAGFQALNGVASPGEEPVFAPPLANFWAAQEALVELLVASGLLDHRRYLIHALTKYAETLEAALAEAVEAKRQRTGVIVPLGTLIDRPQG